MGTKGFGVTNATEDGQCLSVKGKMTNTPRTLTCCTLCVCVYTCVCVCVMGVSVRVCVYVCGFRKEICFFDDKVFRDFL